MRPPRYDIIRKEGKKGSMWLEVATDLNTAESRILELVGLWPGDFQVLDQQTHQIVAEVRSESVKTGKLR
jgi:hypothetical protein